MRLEVPFAPPLLGDGEREALERVLESGWLTTGDECSLLESELEDLLGIPHVVSVASCTAALEIACVFLALDPGALVGVPTWTFASTALAAYRAGGIPVLLDCDPSTLNLSVAAVDAAVRSGLSALVVVHFAGNPIDEAIYGICKSAGVPIIEDAAHALGASDSRGTIAGRGTVGAAFSFYATKNLTAGEGGALSTENHALADFARRYRLHGLSKDAWKRYRPESVGDMYDVHVPGIKANLSDLHAAVARSQLERFPEFQLRRRELVLHYRTRIAQESEIALVGPDLDQHGADHLMVVRLPAGCSRSQIRRALSERGITTSIHFRPLHELDWFADNARVGPAGLTGASDVASSVLSLPLSPALSVEQVDYVCDELINAVHR